MKQKIRAFKALFLAFALIVSLVPAAFASGFCSQGHPTNPTGWQGANSSYHTQYCYMCQNTVYEAHQFSNGSCITCGYSSYNQSNHTHSFNTFGYCTICGIHSSMSQYSHTHIFDGNNCTICGYNYVTGQYNPNHQYNHTHSFNDSNVCIICGYNYATGDYSHTHTFNELGYCTYCGIQNSLDQNNHTHTFNSANICTICGYRYTGQYNHTHVYNDLGYCVYCGLHSSLNQYDHTHIFDDTNTCTICGYRYNSQYNHTHVYNNLDYCVYCGIHKNHDNTDHVHSFDVNNNCITCGYNYVTGLYSHTHSYNSTGYCTVCGIHKDYITFEHSHSFDSTNTCTVCGYRYNGLYDHTHSFNTQNICTVCGIHKNYSNINHVHSFDSTNTCTVCGYRYSGGYNHTHVYNELGICTICGIYNGYNYTDHVHNFNNNYTCTICGYNILTGNGQYNHTHNYNEFGYCTICGYNYLTGNGQYDHTHNYNEFGYCTICGYNYLTGNGQYNHTHNYNEFGYCTICGYNYLTGGSQSGHTHVYNELGVCYYCGAYSGSNTVASISYSAAPGANVKLSASDFQKFWKDRTNSSGTLKYIQITSVSSNGSLCYNHTSSEKSHSSAYGSSFYVSPTAQQKDISKLTFVPTKSNGKYPSGTVTISFTAYGTTQYNNQTSATGSVTITYANTDVQAINYKSAGGYVTLNSKDFISVCQSAAGASTSNFTIKFLDIPSYGKLYSAYTNSGYYGTTGTELNLANINVLSFSGSSSATNSIDKIAYVPGTAGLADSVRYAAYSGNTLLYIGTVNFSTKDIVINYTGNSTGVSFDYYDFYYSNTSFDLQYVSFGTPSSGTLYKNYANGKGTAVTSKDYFNHFGSSTVNAMSTLTYVPKTNYTGVVEIPFTAHNLTGAAFSGTVKVYVVAKPFSDIGGWSAPYINRLYAAGVVGGTSGTTFSPKANMKYGEALKMILLAAGYSKQSETGGKHWATGYLNLAYSKGIVSSTNIDLNALVDRNTVAELTAKALGLSKATSVNAGITAPSDSTNGYVYALYNAGIVSGEGTGTSNKFYGTRNISREEVAKIICNIMDYEK